MYVLFRLLTVIEEGRVRHDEVALVYHAKNDWKVRCLGRVGDTDVREVLVRLGEQYDDVRFFCCLKRTLNTHLLYTVGGLADAGGVYETEGDAVYLYGVFNEVACGTLNVRNDSTLLMYECIHQSTLAYIGSADDGNGDAVFQGIAGAE